MMAGWHDGSGFGWVGWLVVSVLGLAFWAVLIFGGLALFRGGRHDDRHESDGSDARHVLDERFARGEIDEQDYHHRRELLTPRR